LRDTLHNKLAFMYLLFSFEAYLITLNLSIGFEAVLKIFCYNI